MKTRPNSAVNSGRAVLTPVVGDAHYLKAQPLSKALLMALSTNARVYVQGKPHRVKVICINKAGKLIGKLEPLGEAN